MKKLLLTTVLSLAMGFAAEAFQVNYQGVAGSAMNFDGAGNFSFSPSANSFSINNGTAIGDLGQITGTYAIGTITTVAGVSSANVTGSGNFIIHAAGGDFKATLVWGTITQIFTSGTLNIEGIANMTGITYSGTDTDLLALKAASGVGNTLTFQFIPPVTLTALKTTAQSTSFSGSINSTPDGGTTAMLLGCGLLGMAALRGMFKKVTA